MPVPISMPVLDDCGEQVEESHLLQPRSSSSHIALLGPVAFAMAIGVQCMMTALVRFGPIIKPVLPEMTARGKVLAFPEHDMSIYMGGLCGTMLLILTGVWLWRRMFIRDVAGGMPRELTLQREARARFSAALLAVLAAGSLLCFLVLLNSRFPLLRASNREGTGRLPCWVLLLPAAAALFCAAIDLCFGMSRSAITDPRRAMPAQHSRANKPMRWILDAGICGLIVLCIFIPRSKWTDIVGTSYQADELHHLNFFALGPALEYIHGKAFETDFYSQYGIGWPLTFALLSRAGSFTIGRLVGTEIIYGCVYYVALYGLLRLLLQSVPWAASGVLLAIMLQLFSGIDVGAVMWNYPSSTVLRHPADVWFFIALLMHRRSGNAGWIGAAGALAGLAIFYELDTGAYLPAIFVLYLGLCHVNFAAPRRARYLALFGRAVWFAVPLLLVLFVGLWIGSRGTLFHSAFRKGWIEGLKLQAFSGIGLIPVAGVDDTGILLFLSMLCAYLLALGWGIARHLAGGATDEDTFLTCISAYGLAVLLVFVGRSHPYNLYHAAIPFVIVIVIFLNRLQQLARPRLPRSSIPWALTLGVAITLWTKPQFRSYPSLARSFSHKPPAEGKPLAEAIALRLDPRDVTGLPESYRHECATLRAVAARMHRTMAGGKQILVLDDNDTMLYYLSGVAPWSRYASLFHSVLTQQMVSDTEHEILARRPAFVFIRADAPKKWLFEDVWETYHGFIETHYKLQEHIGMYEVWRLAAL